MVKFVATLAELLVNIGADISDFEKSMANMKKGLKETGDQLKGIGQSMTAAVSVPLAGLGFAAMNTASDLQSSTGKMQAALGLTATEADNLKDVAQSLWTDAFGESIEDVSNSLITVKQNMQGLDDGSLQSVAEDAFVLRDTFGAEINESTRTASVMMKNFGIESSKAMDLMTVGFQKGGNFSDELLDTMREYSPQFAAMGMSAEDMLGILIKGAEAGAWNLDKVGDAIKEFTIRSKDGSDTTAEALKALGFNAEEMSAKFAAGGAEASSAFQAVTATLAGMDDPLQRNQIGVALFGTQWEDLEANVVGAMATGIGSLNEIDGATKKAGEALRDNIGVRATEIWREFQASLVPVGEILIGLAEDILPRLGAGIELVSGWFSGLSPVIQQVVVVIGIIAAAIGPLLIILGQIVSAVSALIPVFTTLAGVFTGIVSVGILPIIAAIGALIAIGVLLYQNWEQVSAFAQQAWDAIVAFITPAVEAVTAFIMEKFEEVRAWWNEIWPTLQQAFENIWNGIVAFITPIIEGIVSVFEWAWPYIQKVIEIVWGVIKGVIDGALKVIMNIIGAFANLFTGNWSGLWENIKGIVAGLLKIIGSVIDGALDLIFNNIKMIGDLIFKTVKGAWDSVAEISRSVWNGVSDFILGIWDGIVGGIKGFINLIIKAMNFMIDGINKLSFDVPDWVPNLGGKTFGLDIPNIPMLANGGITTGPTLAMIGEGTEQEAVLPLSKLEQLINTNGAPGITIEQMNVREDEDIYRIARELYSLINSRGRGMGVARL